MDPNDDIFKNKENKDVIYKYKGDGGKIIGYLSHIKNIYKNEIKMFRDIGHKTNPIEKIEYIFNYFDNKTTLVFEKKNVNDSNVLFSNFLGIEECKDCKLEPNKLDIKPGTKIVYKYPTKNWVSKMIFDQGSDADAKAWLTKLDYLKNSKEKEYNEKHNEILNEEGSEQSIQYKDYNNYKCNEFIKGNDKKIEELEKKKKN